MAKRVWESLAENSLKTDSDLIMHLDPTLFVMALDKEFSCAENYPKIK